MRLALGYKNQAKSVPDTSGSKTGCLGDATRIGADCQLRKGISLRFLEINLKK